VIEFKFFLIESENSFHVLHTFLKNLHFLFKLNFLLSLVVGILSFQLFEFFIILFLHLALVKCVLLFLSPAKFEQILDGLIVAIQNFLALLQEACLNLIKLVTVVHSHINELSLHRFDEILNVIVLFFERFHILVIFSSELLHETLNEKILLLNNLFTSFFLNLDVFCQFFAVFLFFQFLPCPIDFDISLMRGNNFSLDLGGTVFSCIFFFNTSLILQSISM